MLTAQILVHRLVRSITFRTLLALTFVLPIVGCVNPQPFLQQASALNPKQGYVAGIFSGQGQGIGFALVNVDSNVEYFMPFFTSANTTADRGEVARIIEVPPGKYRLDHWAAYHPFSREYFVKKKLPQADQLPVLEVKAGKVAFLGRFEASQSGVSGGIQYGFRSLEIRRGEAQAKFAAAYPNFPADAFEY